MMLAHIWGIPVEETMVGPMAGGVATAVLLWFASVMLRFHPRSRV
jgi:hypothetical protein